MPYRLNATTGELDLINSSASAATIVGNSPITTTTANDETQISLNTVPVASGGTGLKTVASNAVLLGNGTGAFKAYQLDCPDSSIILTVDDADSEYKIQANFPTTLTNYVYYSSASSAQFANGTFLICDKDATSNQNEIVASYNPAIHNPVLTIIGDGTHNWKVRTPYSNTVFMVGSISSTAGSGGFIASMNPSDAIQLVAINQNLWAVQVLEGNVSVN